jgi:predicted lipoprotein with Yx(FWY)xxD motif
MTPRGWHATAIAASLMLIASTPLLAEEEDYGHLKMMQTPSGQVLTTPEGMTVYTYEKDGDGVSNCNGECAKKWPPVLAKPGDKPKGKLAIIKRADGTLQWADEEEPLYTYIEDKKPGDVKGDNIGGVWHAAR